MFAKGIDDKYAACSDAIRPIKEIDILDYCEDTKRWYCVVSEYSLDEICVNGLIVPDYKKVSNLKYIEIDMVLTAEFDLVLGICVLLK